MLSKYQNDRQKVSAHTEKKKIANLTKFFVG